MTLLHEALLSVKQEGPGICKQLSRHMDKFSRTYVERGQVWDTLFDLFEGWPEGTGKAMYPVPSPIPDLDAKDAFGHFHCLGTLWEGKYGDNRKALLAYLLEQTK